jgi:cytochrome c/WD40 domain-containing protein
MVVRKAVHNKFLAKNSCFRFASAGQRASVQSSGPITLPRRATEMSAARSIFVQLAIAGLVGVPLRASASDGVKPAASETKEAATSSISFTRDIAAIFVEKCIACHGPKNAESEYRLDSYEQLRKVGASGEPPIVPGKPDSSLLYRLVNSGDKEERMPQEGKALATEQIAVLRRWIESGAPFDGPSESAPLQSILPRRNHPAPPSVYPRPVPVLALAFSPNNERVATGGYHELLLWSAADGSVQQRITNVAQRIHAIAFNPDGTLVAVAAGTPGRFGEVRLFNAQSGELIADLASTTDEMLDVEFSRDGRRLLACGADRTIRTFDVAERKELLRIESHADWVMAAAFSPDGSKIASVSRDKNARIFDSSTGLVQTTYAGHDEQIFDVAFSPDGAYVFTAGRGRELHRWSAEGKDTSKSDIRKKETGAIIGRTTAAIHRLAVSDTRIFAATADGKVFEFDTHPERNDPPPPQEEEKKDGDAKKKNDAPPPKREPLRIYSGPSEQAFAIGVDPAGKRIAVGLFDGQVLIYDTENVEPKLTFQAVPK